MADVKKLFENVSRLYLKDTEKLRQARKFLNELELELAVVDLKKQWEEERLKRSELI